MARGNPRYRRWCFTLNNYSANDWDSLRNVAQGDRVLFLAVSREIGESGTPHLQGYIELSAALRLGGVKDLLGFPGCHLEQANGNRQQNVDYISKDEESGPKPADDIFIVDRGRPGQGTRNDLLECKAILDSGGSLADCFETNFTAAVRAYRGLLCYQQLRSSPRDFPTHCVWIYGATGVGKSRLVYQEAQSLGNGSVAYISDSSGKWFDPYQGHRVVVFDDYDGSMPVPILLRLLDRYPTQVPIKGSFVNWCPRIVYITTNEPPIYYHGADRQWDPLVRRLMEFGQVLKMTRGGETQEIKYDY